MLASLNPEIFPLRSTKFLEYLLITDRKQLKKLAESAGRYYRPFDRLEINEAGKNKWRHIDNPTGKLKIIQKKINKRILKEAMISLPNGMIGGVTGKSTKDNVKFHLKKEMVLTLDLKNCFPNINNQKIYRVWKEILGCGRVNARILTQLTTFQTRLPQGASTSLALCNLALLPLFNDIQVFASAHNLNFTLYVDDIAISGKFPMVQSSISPIINLIQKHGYAIGHKKIRIMPANVRQKITGIIVNKKTAIEIQKIEEIRGQILNAARKKIITKNDLDSIWGKIDYIKNISPARGEKLSHFAAMLLPDSVEIYTKPVNYKIRKCTCTKRHKTKRP
ncbi:MAG TPA: reverse transcriptase family protein [Patescibacteria group bacterium]|nr:reverse transcriptase family protein [Patescibacteria group bacterium]